MQLPPLVQQPPSPASRQLPLALEVSPTHPGLAQPTITFTPRQVWASLTPQLQAQVRQTLLHIIQEIVRNGEH